MTLVEYDAAWPKRYRAQAWLVREALGDAIMLLEHVGSTSVPGLVAKPVVDIVLAVDDSAAEPGYVPPLESQGFALRVREPNWHEHRMLKGGVDDVNLHVFSARCPEIERMLAFRDRLRSDSADRGLYATAKAELAAQRWDHLQDYADAKSAIVEEIVSRARAESPPVSPAP
ncbi:GrpB family protein [Ornithinimicrobium cryptoxanthini]|uniref:GrpB family protein n=1 Tax=Ornithinimicrobium cryptoxanthini TaxID=2934161 RepID=UPI00211961BC